MSPFTLIGRIDLNEVSKQSRTSTGLWNNVELILGGIIVIAGLWAALYFWNRFREKLLRHEDSPASLFHELCRVHRLNRAEKALLMQAVESGQLAEPAVVFVNPHVLQRFADSRKADDGAGRELLDKLFGRVE